MLAEHDDDVTAVGMNPILLPVTSSLYPGLTLLINQLTNSQLIKSEKQENI